MDSLRDFRISLKHESFEDGIGQVGESWVGKDVEASS